MPTLKNIPVGTSWYDPAVSKVCDTGAPRTGLGLYDHGIFRVEPLGIHGPPFPLSMQPSHGAGLAMMKHRLPTPAILVTS